MIELMYDLNIIKLRISEAALEEYERKYISNKQLR